MMIEETEHSIFTQVNKLEEQLRDIARHKDETDPAWQHRFNQVWKQLDEIRETLKVDYSKHIPKGE